MTNFSELGDPLNSVKKLQVVTIGAGYFSRFHVDSWQRIDAVEHVAVVDTNVQHAEWTGVPVFSETRTMLQAMTPDIVDIVTPPSTHLTLIDELSRSGIKAVICQKPFCGNILDARRAVELAQKAGMSLVIHENFRFQPWYRMMYKELQSGACGEPCQLTFRLRTGDGQGDKAYLDRQPYFQTMPRLLIHETGVHWVDTFRFLLGEPASVFADLRRINPVIAGEDAGYFIFQYENGSRALFDGNRLLDNGAVDPRLTLGDALLEGPKATIRLDPDGSLHKRSFNEVEFACILPAGNYPGFGGDCVHALQSHFVASYLNGCDFENSAADYLRNIEIVNAVYKSSESGRQVTVAMINR